LKRFLRYLAVVVGLLVVFLVFAAVSAWPNVGSGANDPRAADIVRSPQWHGDRFANPLPMYSNLKGGIWQMLESQPGEEPDAPVPTIDSSAVYARPPSSGLRVTWFGHSSMLVEIDGANIVVDPLWSERPSPFPWLGPKRW